MADISRYLQDILQAVYGEEVRGSIHDAIEIINDVSEVVLTTGTAVDSASSSSEGFFTDSLYLNTNTFELWKCVGTDTWQSQGIIKGPKGEDGEDGQDGADGNRWYRGLGISGKAPNPTVYSGSGITEANPNDFYLNPSEGAIYHCVTGGDASTATWSYDFTMTGGGGSGSIVTWNQIQGATGSTKIAEIDIDGSTQDVYAPSGGSTGAAWGSITGTLSSQTDLQTALDGKINNPSTKTQDQILRWSGSAWIADDESAGGHTMLPTPSASVDEAAVVSAVNGAIIEGGLNDDVPSLYGMSLWSNCDAIQLLTPVAVDSDGLGEWEDDDTWEASGHRTGWLKDASLYGVLSDDDVEIQPVFKILSGNSDGVGVATMRIDDGIESDIGGVAFKFTAPIQTSGAYVGVRLKRLRTKTKIITP